MDGYHTDIYRKRSGCKCRTRASYYKKKGREVRACGIQTFSCGGDHGGHPLHEFELHPGDSLFVYTDGVPEATNAQNELYGTDRMLEALNSDPDAEVKQLLENVKKSVDDFVGDAPQFDDLTMLAFDYFGV